MGRRPSELQDRWEVLEFPSHSETLVPTDAAKDRTHKLGEKQFVVGGDLAQQLQRQTVAAVQQFAGWTRPRGHGVCDHNEGERWANLLTSVPYGITGSHIYRHRAQPAARAWGISVIGIALGSLAFHAARGKWKPVGRRLDYWTIAVSSCLMSRCLYPKTPRLLTAAQTAIIPFCPLPITCLNIGVAEVAFRNSARVSSQMRRLRGLHVAAGAVGAATFCLEGIYPHFPGLHATWHCLSCLGVATTGDLVAARESSFL